MLIMYGYVTAKRFIIVSSSTGKRPKISLGELNLPLGREVPGESKSKTKRYYPSTITEKAKPIEGYVAFYKVKNYGLNTCPHSR